MATQPSPPQRIALGIKAAGAALSPTQDGKATPPTSAARIVLLQAADGFNIDFME